MPSINEANTVHPYYTGVFATKCGTPETASPTINRKLLEQRTADGRPYILAVLI
ncbi:MAG: hypothetical protein FWE47_03090 [Oscillospiraceae bacterium]|nr:hypothetical protein [Oscillospiraceae bacterium]